MTLNKIYVTPGKNYVTLNKNIVILEKKTVAPREARIAEAVPGGARGNYIYPVEVL